MYTVYGFPDMESGGINMTFNKEKFLLSELGIALVNDICTLNAYMVEIRGVSKDKNSADYNELMSDIDRMSAKWQIYKLAIKQFYGIEYYFTRTDEYYGVCKDDDVDDFLVKKPQIKTKAL